MKKRLKRNINKTKRRIKKFVHTLKDFFAKHCKPIVYGIIFLLGLTGISMSFYVTDNWINVTCGIGTGILTSLLVTIIINAENDAREKRKTEREKRFLFNEIIMSSLDVYEDVIYRINEYLTLSELDIKGKYALYDDFKPFNEFADYLKTIDITKITDKEKERLNKLFNFRNYRIDYLISNLKHLPRQEYYLEGLLSEEEYNKLISQTANDSYLSYAENLDDFWDDEVLNLEKCIQFLRMTIYITSRTIATFDYAIKKANDIDDRIKKDIDQLYFDEIYSQSEEYIESQIRIAEDEAEYFASHLEEAEELEKFYNKTEEDFNIDYLYSYFFGFCAYDLETILKKLDKDSEKVKSFFAQKEIQKAIRKRKNKAAIQKIYGKNYMKEVTMCENNK